MSGKYYSNDIVTILTSDQPVYNMLSYLMANFSSLKDILIQDPSQRIVEVNLPSAGINRCFYFVDTYRVPRTTEDWINTLIVGSKLGLTPYRLQQLIERGWLYANNLPSSDNINRLILTLTTLLSNNIFFTSYHINIHHPAFLGMDNQHKDRRNNTISVHIHHKNDR